MDPSFSGVPKILGLADEARPRPQLDYAGLLSALAHEPLVRRYAQTPYETEFEMALRVRERSLAAAAVLQGEASAAGRVHPVEQSEAISLARFRPLLVCRRGIWHVSDDLPCQDAAACCRDERSLVLALCDGASTAPLAHYGAGLLARAAAELAKRRADALRGPLACAEFLGGLHADLYLVQHQIAGQLGLLPTDAHDLLLAATIQLLVVRPRDSLVLALGDGSLLVGDRCYDLPRTLGREISIHASNRPPLLSYLIASDADGLHVDPQRPDAEALRAMLGELTSEAQGLPLVSQMPTTQLADARRIGLETDGGRVRKRAANARILQELTLQAEEGEFLRTLALVDAATDESGSLIDYGLLPGIAEEAALREHLEGAVREWIPEAQGLDDELRGLSPGLMARFLAAGPPPAEAPRALLRAWPDGPRTPTSEFPIIARAIARRLLRERFAADAAELESFGDDYGLALLRS